MYQDGYVEPLNGRLTPLAEVARKASNQEPAPTLLGAVYGHDPENQVSTPLRNLLLVVADLYRSFLAKEKLARLNLHLIETVPPLAAFRAQGDAGPFTYPADSVEAMIGARIGVVSIPSVYRNHPLLWGLLAHETGGHDVIHACEPLLPELCRGIQSMFDATVPVWGSAGTELGALWCNWADETTADVYGILNYGPAYAIGLVSWLVALSSTQPSTSLPVAFSTASVGSNGVLDTHPPDLLRIWLAVGVVEVLGCLDPWWRAGYASLLRSVAQSLAPAAMTIRGEVPSGDTNTSLNWLVPAAVMQQSAEMVGRYIASAHLKSLNGHTIQDIETWDDADERMAMACGRWIVGGAALPDAADPSHLIVGATYSALLAPEGYERWNTSLCRALDALSKRDPVWGPAGNV
jgi:hypothetical protein